MAEALAEAADVPLIRLQCHEGIDASQALYDWDFPRQILHLRAVETVGATSGPGSLADVEASLFDERFLLARPVLRALREAPAVPSSRDRRADEELRVLSIPVAWHVSNPGSARSADTPPLVASHPTDPEVHAPQAP